MHRKRYSFLIVVIAASLGLASLASPSIAAAPTASKAYVHRAVRAAVSKATAEAIAREVLLRATVDGLAAFANNQATQVSALTKVINEQGKALEEQSDRIRALEEAP